MITMAVEQEMEGSNIGCERQGLLLLSLLTPNLGPTASDEWSVFRPSMVNDEGYLPLGNCSHGTP
jgi:hypothetical protein